jgi:putative FmdB family regulatory protein
MPLYEFRCPIGHDFEKFYRSIGSAPTEERCPECGALAERLMSAAGFAFKGSGFYITDYGKDGKKAEREAAKSASAKSEKSETAAISIPDSATSSKSSDKPASKPAESSATAPAKSSTDPKPATGAAKPASAPKKSE